MIKNIAGFLWKKRKIFIGGALLILSLVLLHSLTFVTTMRVLSQMPVNKTVIKGYRENRTTPIVILVDTGQPVDESRKSFPSNLFPEGRLSKEKCPVQSNCIYVYDKDIKSEIDAVLVYYSRLSPSKLAKLYHDRPKSSYIYFNLESPVQTVDLDWKYDKIFSYTATYQRNSDIVTPYFNVEPISITDSKNSNNNNEQIVNYAAGKTNLVVAMISNCLSFRLEFIKNLQKHIDVSLFGRCQTNSTMKCGRFEGPDCLKIHRSYKFYLALENSYCTDYVTEKLYYQAFQQGLVPVALTRANLNNARVAPPKSIINIMDFKNTKELADYLLYLDKNDTAYNEYHQWRTKYRVFNHRFACDTCEQLWKLSSNVKAGQRKVKLTEFWSPEKQCISFKDELFQKLLT